MTKQQEEQPKVSKSKTSVTFVEEKRKSTAKKENQYKCKRGKQTYSIAEDQHVKGKKRNNTMSEQQQTNKQPITNNKNKWTALG